MIDFKTKAKIARTSWISAGIFLWYLGCTVMEAPYFSSAVLIFEIRDRRFERPIDLDGASADDGEDILLCFLTIGIVAAGFRSRLLFLDGHY